MNKKNYLSLTYIFSIVLFFGIGISRILINTKETFIFSIILGSLIGTLILSLLNNHKINSNNKVINILMFITLYILFIIGLTILLDFITTTYLINTNKYIILVPLIILILYMNSKSMDIHIKVANIIIYIISILFITSYLLLIPKINYMNFLPLFNISFKKLLFSSFEFALYSVTPNILYSQIDYNVENVEIIKKYIFSNIILLIIMFIIIGILGSDIISIFKYPEYIILKNIKTLSFIENVENIYSIMWIFISIIFISLCSKEMNDICYKKNKYIYPIFLILSTILLNHLLFNNILFINFLYNYLWIILSIIMFIYLSIILIKKIKF